MVALLGVLDLEGGLVDDRKHVVSPILRKTVSESRQTELIAHKI